MRRWPTVERMVPFRRRVPLRPSWSLGAAVWTLAAVAVGTACADTGDGALLDDDTTDAAAATTTVTAVEPEVPPDDSDQSFGRVRVGDTVYQFTVTCQEQGAGEVVVIGAGDDGASGELVELYLQAFIGDPYVGLRLADGSRVEPSFESDLALYVQNDVIRASAIRFVKDLDLDTGEATEVGFGELEIHCNSYQNELPEQEPA